MFKRLFKRDKELHQDEVLITYRVKKHLKKDFKVIGNEYITGEITHKDFFVENHEINEYFYDLLRGTKHTFKSQFCWANILIEYENRDEFNDAKNLCKWFINSGYKNFEDYHFLIVWKDNLNNTQVYFDDLEIIERLMLYQIISNI